MSCSMSHNVVRLEIDAHEVKKERCTEASEQYGSTSLTTTLI